MIGTPWFLGTGAGGAFSDQYLEDERIALMLQNEEFMAELQKDSEFMSALEMEQERALYDQQLHQRVPKTNKMDSDTEFREKLKTMGKTSKKKFAQLAAMFSRRKSAAKQFLGHAAAPSKDNLLLNAEPLVNEDDTDTEEDAKKQKTPTKGKYTSFSWKCWRATKRNLEILCIIQLQSLMIELSWKCQDVMKNCGKISICS